MRAAFASSDSFHDAKQRRLFRVVGLVGTILLAISFSINPAPPEGAGAAELLAFAQQHHRLIAWGAWLQAVGPVFVCVFAFGLVFIAGAQARLAGYLTLFGAVLLMVVNLMEVTLYVAALSQTPPEMPFVALSLIQSVQHLFFVVAAPALLLPLAAVLLKSRVLPRAFGYVAAFIGISFAVIGALYAERLRLPDAITALGGVQALWWLAASVTLVVKGEVRG